MKNKKDKTDIRRKDFQSHQTVIEIIGRCSEHKI